MSGAKCAACGAANEPGARFCGECGKPLEAVSTMAGGVKPGKTMLMQTAPPSPQPPAPPAAPAAPKGLRDAGPARTMLGVTAGPIVPKPAAPSAPAGPARTMLGLSSSPVAAWPPAEPSAVKTAPLAPPPPAAQAPSQPVGSARTMPAPAPEPSLPPESVPPLAEPSFEPAAPSYDDDLGDAVPKKGTSVVVWMVLGASLILGLAAAAIWVFVIRGSETPADVAVARSPDGASAILDVRLAPFVPGTKVRLGAREVDAAAGVARFVVPIAELHVGANDLVATLIVPGQDPETRPVHLFLSYRARADLAGLSQTPPRYDVVFDLPPGARVETATGAFAAGPDGHVTVPVPVATLASALDPEGRHRFDFRVVGADQTAEPGSLVTVVPMTRLVLDRPGAEAVTEAADIECAGMTEDGAVVLVEGTQAPLTEGRFTTKVALGAVGPHEIHVQATAPGKAPKTMMVTVRRVASLRAEIQAFERESDSHLTWTEAAQNPAENRGRRVSYLGKIFNLRTEEGVTAIQALVHDCPRGQRCSLWVVYRGMTDAQSGDWVRIYGVLDGEQTYVTSRGEQLTVPRVEGRFVVKTRAP